MEIEVMNSFKMWATIVKTLETVNSGSQPGAKGTQGDFS